MRGADVNGTRDGSELTALHEATRQGRLAAVLLLLANGADPNAQKETGGVGPLDVAAFSESDREDEAAALRSAGAVCFRATGALCGPQTVASCSAEGLVLNGAVCAGECPEGKTNSNGSCVLSTVASRCGESELVSESGGSVCVEVCPAGYVSGGETGSCVVAVSVVVSVAVTSTVVTETTVCEGGTLPAEGLTQAELDAGLLDAAAGNQAKEVCKWIRRGANIHARTRDEWWHARGKTPLHVAAENNAYKTAKLLIDNGAEVTLTSPNGYTPLHETMEHGETKIMELLLDNGANVDARNWIMATPLHYAAAGHKNHLAAARLLIERGADVDAQDSTRTASGETWRSRETPLYWASSREMAELLIQNGADVGARLFGGWTPLHDVDRLEFGKAKALLDNGADINARDNGGMTPLMAFVSWHSHWTGEGKDPRVKMAEMFVSRGADINAQDNNGDTALHYAISGVNYYGVNVGINRHEVKTLITLGANATLRNNRGETPLDMATRPDRVSVSAKILALLEKAMNGESGDDSPAVAASVPGGTDEVAERLRGRFAEAFDAGPAFGDAFGAVGGTGSGLVGRLDSLMRESGGSGRSRFRDGSMRMRLGRFGLPQASGGTLGLGRATGTTR